MGSRQIPRTMKALVKQEEVISYVLEDIEVPSPVDDEVLIRVDLVSICGSDIALYQWNDVAKVIASIPFTPGHECTGVVVKTGPTATLSMGQRVAVENHFYCGECFQCKDDRGDICQNLGQYGHGRKTMHGGCSEYSIVSSKYCYCIDSDITPAQATMMEPAGVAHNAMEQLEVENEDVLIIGAGPVGLMACNIAKAMGAKRVVAADIDNKRLELAKKMGADVTVNTKDKDIKQFTMDMTNNNGFGRVCEMSGASVMVNGAFSLLRKGGVIVMVGLPKTALHVENVLPDIVFKSLTLRTIHGRRIFHTWEEVERLIAERKINVDDVISHTFPMSRYEEAFQTLFSGKACKIILNPHE